MGCFASLFLIWTFWIVGSALSILLTCSRFKVSFVRRAVVVVGGDFSRSPRMQYHASSIYKYLCPIHCEQVVLVGYNCGNRLSEPLERAGSEHICTSYLVSPVHLPLQSLFNRAPRATRRFVWVFLIVYKVLLQIAKLMFVLFPLACPRITRSTKGGLQITATIFFIVQTPPAVPILPVLRLALWHSSIVTTLYRHVLIPATATHSLSQQVKRNLMLPRLIIDWHNLGFSIMEINRRPAALTIVYKFIESTFSRADAHLTVSQAMRDQLTLQHSGKNSGKGCCTPCNFMLPKEAVKVLYDCPPEFFAPATTSEFLRAARDSFEGPECGIGQIPHWVMKRIDDREPGGEAFENAGPDGVHGRIVVSSTSWTADDDYSLVVEALKTVDSKLIAYNAEYPEKKRYLWVVCTGKGETRTIFERQVAAAGLSDFVAVSTVYFQCYRTYAKMLGAADVGLSVHKSSSGYDLPMKCVDMFGCGLPVLAFNYQALSELIPEDGSTGWLFNSAKELAELFLKDVLGLFDNGKVTDWDEIAKCLNTKRRAVAKRYSRRWDDEWKAVCLPCIEDIIRKTI